MAKEKSFEEQVRDYILTYGFRSTVEILMRSDYREQDAIAIVRRVHDRLNTENEVNRCHS